MLAEMWREAGFYFILCVKSQRRKGMRIRRLVDINFVRIGYH